MVQLRTCLIVAASRHSCHIYYGRVRHVSYVGAFVPSCTSRRLHRNKTRHKNNDCYWSIHHDNDNWSVHHSANAETDTTYAHHITTSVSNQQLSRKIDIPPSIESRIQDLVIHPAVGWDESSTFASMHKKKLRRRHLQLFDRSNKTKGEMNYDMLFDQFAQAVCNAGVVAQKEVFETWASALYIYSSFLSSESANCNNIKPIHRVADIAGGHGLLAWAFLLLDDEHQRSQATETESSSQPLTAFCLDVHMPRSAELIHSAMIQQFPHLEKRFDYVEGRLEQLVPHPSCLLASVHACGILSDILVSTAAEQSVPLAVVPCCHSRKEKVLEVASPFAKSLYDDIILSKGIVPNLADRLDEARMVALENAGMDVYEVYIPTLFTDKNRLIMAFPIEGRAKSLLITESDHDTPKQPVMRGRMPPLSETSSSIILPKARYMKGFSVPCKDDTKSREIVTKLSGKIAANNRKEAMHNRNHTKSPQMDISMWLPNEDVGLSEEALTNIIESKHSNVKCTITKLGSVYVSPDGRKAQTFRFLYSSSSETVLPFEDAKSMHEELYKLIPVTFPGAECR